jgi:hypothetical protein
MQQFIAKYGDRITGVLSGFDRLVLRGSLRAISYVRGMMGYLWASQVPLKEFAGHVEQVSRRLKEASLKEAGKKGRPVQYLTSSQEDKEAIARAIAHRDGIRKGLVCVLTCVEPCLSFDIWKNRQSQQLELVIRHRKCLFLYHYWIHPVFGFMNARIQTWFPFPIQICLNGREWLTQSMDRAQLHYERRDNCFVSVQNYQQAQRLLDEQLRMNWAKSLRDIARQLNPIHERIFQDLPIDYYWSTFQSEWATDIVFRTAGDLQRLYPLLIHHGITTFGSPDVLRFLGKKLTMQGQVHGNLGAEVVTDVKKRTEGVRIKHRLGRNSIKLYDKAHTSSGSVLRAETTLNEAEAFKVFRSLEGERRGEKDWRRMRKGIADLHRRADVSQKANERYLNAMASIDESTTVQECLQSLDKPIRWKQSRIRALHPFSSDDSALLEAISRGEFTLNGFRNKDLQALLYSTPTKNLKDARRRSAVVSRKIRLLRAHGLLRKVPNTYRYHVTDTARPLLATLLAARRATAKSLTGKAA